MSATVTASHAPTQDQRFHVRFLWAVTLLSGGVLWLRPIASSFWEDELVTWWVIDGSFREMLHRSYALQGQSALYYPCLLYTSPSPRDPKTSRMPSSA